MANDFSIDLKLAKQLLSFRDFPNDRGKCTLHEKWSLDHILLPLRDLLESRNKGKRVTHYIYHTKKKSALAELEISFPIEKIAYANAF